MKQMCKYALVQFMPFVETGEFANVGVLLCAPKTGKWEFKLAPPKFKRITDFFTEMDRQVYSIAVRKFQNEMQLTQQIALNKKPKEMVDFFNEITRPRQALIRFSNVRTIMADTPEQALLTLFERFIRRDFVTEVYKENQMVQAIRQKFNVLNLKTEYKERKLKAGFRAFTVPLTANTDNGLKLIKPIAFNQGTATKLYEHGEVWVQRLKALLEENMVKQENILLPYYTEKALKGEKLDALTEIKNLFRKENLGAVDYNKENKIIEFAKEQPQN